MQHRHHILPIRLGGTNDEDNLTPPISTQLHAAFHKDLYEHYGMKEDYIAWKALEGRITNEQARLMAAKSGQDKSEKYKLSRTGKYFELGRTKENCSLGGKIASKSLVEWQKNNKEAFKKQCSINGKIKASKQLIPHKYNGVIYSSKKELQAMLKISNTGFYNKVKRGEIEKLITNQPKELS